MIRITFTPEYIFKIGSFGVSNTIFCSWLAIMFLVVIAFIYFLTLKKHKDKPNRFQLIVELLLEKIYNFIHSISRSSKITKMVFPLIATFFLYILTENLLALFPGFLGAFYVKGDVNIPLLRSPNSDINATLALAFISVLSIQYFGIKVLGFRRYLGRFFSFTNPIKLFLGFFEMFSDLTKVLSLSFRLFGNILAGEILLLVLAFFTPYFLPLPFLILEIFVGVIQAFIFSTLSLVFIKNAVEKV